MRILVTRPIRSIQIRPIASSRPSKALGTTSSFCFYACILCLLSAFIFVGYGCISKPTPSLRITELPVGPSVNTTTNTPIGPLINISANAPAQTQAAATNTTATSTNASASSTATADSSAANQPSNQSLTQTQPVAQPPPLVQNQTTVQQNQTAAQLQPSPATQNFSNITTPDGKLIVYYFHSSKCSACMALRPEIDLLKTKYPDVVWMEFDLANKSGSRAYLDFAAQFNLSRDKLYVPQVLVNGTIITDRFKINASLDSLIANFTAFSMASAR